jgi:beta-N-acetylglucosaminidase
LISISKRENHFKTLLKAKGRISSGELYLVKGKAFETGGGISNLKRCF